MSSHTPASEHHNLSDLATFGFWTYLMTDLLLFASLFATYAVLHRNLAGGPSGLELFEMPAVLAETIILLTSSFTCGVAMLAVYKRNKAQTLIWFAITLILGLCFLAIEINEFATLIHEGNGPDRSAFLSSFFTLVGTHGFHIASGSLLMLFSMIELARRGFTDNIVTRLACVSLFWHFLDIVWIFIFTFVYLLGALHV